MYVKPAHDTEVQKLPIALEYDPQPSFDCGSPDKAPKEISDKLIKIRNIRLHYIVTGEYVKATIQD